MNKKSIVLSLLVIIASYSLDVSAQVTVDKIGQTGMKFLSVSVGARGAAMGDAFSTLSDNAEAMFWNPAGITQVKKQFDFAIGYNKWIADINHEYFSAVYNAGAIGSFGVSLYYVDYGQIEGTIRSDADPRGYVETGNFSPSAYVVGLTYARAVSERFSFGMNLKYVRQDLGNGYVATGTNTEDYKSTENKLGEMAFDFGTLYLTGFHDIRLAVNVSNLSLERKFIRESFPLPITLKFGLAADIFKSFFENSPHQLILAVEALHLRDYSERAHFGLEYGFENKFFLRAGYKANYDEDNYSAGVGVKLEDIRVDYSYNPFGTLNAVHRVSLGYQM